MDYRVAIGKYEDGKLILPGEETFDPQYIQKMRVFCEDKELFLWRKEESIFSWRERIDTEGNEQDVIDAWQPLWGTKIENLEPGWTKTTENRGTSLVVPFGLKEENLPIRLLTRNYIDYNDNFQAGYVDCRFVAFTDRDKNILGGK